MTKVFILGATGYVAGAVIDQLAVEHPDLDITVLSRSAEKAAVVTTKHPKIHAVIGDLNSSAIIEEQSALADIVFNCADCDHEESARAINRGLAKRESGYLIFASGIGMLWDTPNGSVLGDKIWDDIADLDELRSYPIEAMHSNVEKIIFEAPSSIRVALVSAGLIYGVSTSTKRFTVPFYGHCIRHHGSGFIIGTGVSTTGTIHVLDLARLFVVIIGEALKPNGGIADWGVEGYYFGVADEVSVKDYVGVVSNELAKLGHIKSNKVEVLSIEEVKNIHPFLPYPLGSNARVVSSRAKKLGWKPVQPGVLESLAIDIQTEYAIGLPTPSWGPLGL